MKHVKPCSRIHVYVYIFICIISLYLFFRAQMIWAIIMFLFVQFFLYKYIFFYYFVTNIYHKQYMKEKRNKEMPIKRKMQNFKDVLGERKLFWINEDLNSWVGLKEKKFYIENDLGVKIFVLGFSILDLVALLFVYTYNLYFNIFSRTTNWFVKREH